MEISCQRAAGFALVTAAAVMTPGDADRLHTVLLQAFAEGDDVVVSDLTAAGTASSLRCVAPAVAARVAPWPGALLVVVGGEPLPAPPPTGVTRMDRLPDAVELATARRRPQHARRPLQPLLEAPSLARAFLRSTLASWDADSYGDDAMLVVDELVANAVLHAGTEIELRFALSRDRLGVAVADRSPDRPSVEHPGGAAERGGACCSSMRSPDRGTCFRGRRAAR